MKFKLTGFKISWQTHPHFTISLLTDMVIVFRGENFQKNTGIVTDTFLSLIKTGQTL